MIFRFIFSAVVQVTMQRCMSSTDATKSPPSKRQKLLPSPNELLRSVSAPGEISHDDNPEDSRSTIPTDQRPEMPQTDQLQRIRDILRDSKFWSQDKNEDHIVTQTLWELSTPNNTAVERSIRDLLVEMREEKRESTQSKSTSNLAQIDIPKKTESPTPPHCSPSPRFSITNPEDEIESNSQSESRDTSNDNVHEDDTANPRDEFIESENIKMDKINKIKKIEKKEKLDVSKLHQKLRAMMPPINDHTELYQQSSAEWCSDIETCPCILRIESILKIYELYQDDIGIGRDIDQFFEMKNYSKTALENDFQHIHQIHTTNLEEIVRRMRKKVQCVYSDCEAAARDRLPSGAISSKSTRRGLMDKIHSFFLQFSSSPDSLYIYLSIICVCSLCFRQSLNLRDSL